MTEIFILLADLALALGVAPLNQHGGCWEVELGNWRLAVNGHAEPTIGLGHAVPPFSCYAEYKGWPAGIIDPAGGVMAAGKEDELIDAIKAKIAEATP